MAYNKKYAELGESVIDYVNDREDAIETSFNDVDTQFSGVETEISDINTVLDGMVDYIVEQGTNYTKWASGKLEQWGSVQKSSVSLTQIASTPFYWLANIETSDYPIPFVGTLPTVTFDVNRISNEVWGGLVNSSRTLTKPGLYDIYGTSSTMNSHAYSYHAIGRWK